METFIKKHLTKTCNDKDRISTQELLDLYNLDKNDNLYINTFSIELNKFVEVSKIRIGLQTISGIKGYKLKNYNPETDETFLI